MGYYRKVRKHENLHIKHPNSPPVVVRVKCGRACVEVEACSETKISHTKRKPLTRGGGKE